ncbi:haloacid dehalogenase [Citricoccus sp. SGAir0253]|uniref:haloacid dehalogenase n=1 Tax=Citricoccus sp. SGAir0253 TaxID=2567881 RepID=UPI0010CD45AD|nr:haloacid dehalogenase [Citricoccus sp. SGAir0253]QCU79020.1 haloacid dehalogenase [Citricoccus sp. SGAir0253]
MRTLPIAGFLLDVDGPIASPETRRVPGPILEALVRLAERGDPVVFNTGRSAEFVVRQLAEPLRAAGLPAGARFHAVCEKGAVRFSFADLPDGGLPDAGDRAAVPGWLRVDEGMRVPEDTEETLARLVREEFGATMFHDDTKLAMFSAEMNVGESLERYQPEQSRFEDRARERLDADGLADEFRVDPTIISSDVEHRTSGKDLGAARAWDLVAADGELPVHWYTCGDSRSDYAMADWLHERGAGVTHVDARPEDGVPEVPYPVLTSRELAAEGFGPADGVHEQTGRALLEWALNMNGSAGSRS